MLLTEHTLKAAIETFLKEAHIPRPRGWSIAMDEVWLNHVCVPAFYKALQEIEEVQPSHGFDLENVYPNNAPFSSYEPNSEKDPGVFIQGIRKSGIVTIMGYKIINEHTNGICQECEVEQADTTMYPTTTDDTRSNGPRLEPKEVCGECAQKLFGTGEWEY